MLRRRATARNTLHTLDEVFPADVEALARYDKASDKPIPLEWGENK